VLDRDRLATTTSIVLARMLDDSVRRAVVLAARGTPKGADFAHREQSFRSIMNASISDRERSEATLGATRRWGRTNEQRLLSIVEMTSFVFERRAGSPRR
jgi:hypothetical protein